MSDETNSPKRDLQRSARPVRSVKTSKKVATKKAAEKAVKKVPPRRNQLNVQARFPRHSIERALRIPEAILNQNAGQPASPLEAAKFLGLSSAGGHLGSK
jgi:hypothetical protein